MVKYLFGIERYLIHYSIEREKAQLIDGGKLFDFDCHNVPVEKAIWLCSVPALMSEKKFIVTYAEELTKDSKAAELSRIVTDAEVRVIVGKVDKRSKLYTSLIESGQLVEYGRLDPVRFNQFLMSQFSRHSCKITESDYAHLKERIAYGAREDCDLYLVKNWIEVLSGLDVIDTASIDEVIPEYVSGNQFELFKELCSGNTERYFKLINKVSQTQGMIEILALLLRGFRIAYKLSLVGRENAKSELGLEAFQIRDIKDIREDKCISCISLLTDGIKRLKSSENEQVVCVDVSARIVKILAAS